MESEVIPVPPDTEYVSCDGGDPVLGHPVVWYPLPTAPGAKAACWYCSRVFVRGT
ncbi:MAG TPA: zinc-finger domain-containing protein [Rhodospirillaceae bacterium]|nr:zinc-finger domain-containing protein [Alphaproteobacteria bacterium]HBH26495.1 zinc-finger domain-containing protein [Rhodospirillaceae bacterium]